MVGVEDLVFHAPCMVFDQADGLSQLACRLDTDLTPSLILRDELSPGLTDRVVSLLRGRAENVSFDIGHFSPDRVDSYARALAQASHLAEAHPEIFSPSVGTSFNLLVERNDATPYSKITIDEFETRLVSRLSSLRALDQQAAELGSHLEIENLTRPAFGWNPNEDPSLRGFGEFTDPYPRWNGEWTALPSYWSDVGSTSQELRLLFGELTNARLQLDVEHLVQTVAWGSIFNFENATDGVLYFGDLSAEQRWQLRQYNIAGNDEDVLFDYSSLTERESAFLDKWGYVFRKEGPVVYKERLTFEKELEGVMQLPIGAINPGFAAYMGVWDTVDGSPKLVIADHLPGITEQYIKSPELRARLTDEVRAIHSILWSKMKERGLKDIELEPHIDDGTKLVYAGASWSSQAKEARRQVIENFTLADRGEVDLKKGPAYLM